METWRGVEHVPPGWGRCVATIGVFDGVHRGHRQIVDAAVARSRELSLPSLVLTFDPHPAEVVRPGSHPAVLTPVRRKAELLAAEGVDVLCVQPFTLEFSRLSADAFVHEVLVDRLHVASVVVGRNFRFGHKASGDIDRLTTDGRAFGFTVSAVDLVTSGDVTLSSTYVRACVDAGDVAAAAEVLGRPHRIEGTVVRGERRGAALGFPTANVESPAYAAIPGDGVYACRVRLARQPEVDARRRSLRRKQPDIRRGPAHGRGVPPRLQRRPVR